MSSTEALERAVIRCVEVGREEGLSLDKIEVEIKRKVSEVVRRFRPEGVAETDRRIRAHLRKHRYGT